MGREKPGFISWHHPDPRAIVPLDDGFHISRSLALVLRQHKYTVTFDQAFLQVMEACADRPGVWITSEFYDIYGQLHAQGKFFAGDRQLHRPVVERERERQRPQPRRGSLPRKSGHGQAGPGSGSAQGQRVEPSGRVP